MRTETNDFSVFKAMTKICFFWVATESKVLLCVGNNYRQDYLFVSGITKFGRPSLAIIQAR